ncbi:hypothetical protein VTO73DRAFT_8435 [Trametes versicolor]
MACFRQASCDMLRRRSWLDSSSFCPHSAAVVFASWLPAPLPIACIALFPHFADGLAATNTSGTLSSARSSRHRVMKSTWTNHNASQWTLSPSLHEASPFLGARAYARARFGDGHDSMSMMMLLQGDQTMLQDSLSTRRRATLFRTHSARTRPFAPTVPGIVLPSFRAQTGSRARNNQDPAGSWLCPARAAPRSSSTQPRSARERSPIAREDAICMARTLQLGSALHSSGRPSAVSGHYCQAANANRHQASTSRDHPAAEDTHPKYAQARQGTLQGARLNGT